MNRMGAQSRHYPTPTDQYTADEIEFLRAMDRFKKDGQKPFPTWREVLGVLRSLGWEKVAPTAVVNLTEESGA